jgi:hypothetical protein
MAHLLAKDQRASVQGRADVPRGEEYGDPVTRSDRDDEGRKPQGHHVPREPAYPPAPGMTGGYAGGGLTPLRIHANQLMPCSISSLAS